jgi:hypothetical protein
VVTPELLQYAIQSGTTHFEVEVYTLDLIPGVVERHRVLADDLKLASEYLDPMFAQRSER